MHVLITRPTHSNLPSIVGGIELICESDLVRTHCTFVQGKSCFAAIHVTHTYASLARGLLGTMIVRIRASSDPFLCASLAGGGGQVQSVVCVAGRDAQSGRKGGGGGRHSIHSTGKLFVSLQHGLCVALNALYHSV